MQETINNHINNKNAKGRKTRGDKTPTFLIFFMKKYQCKYVELIKTNHNPQNVIFVYVQVPNSQENGNTMCQVP